MLAKVLVLLLGLSAVSVDANSTPKVRVVTSCTVKNTVAMTFDDGPYQWMPLISNMLTQKGAKGTFFVNGNNYDCIYARTVSSYLQQTYLAGHQIAAHTWSHPDLTTLSVASITKQLNKIDDALFRVLGINTTFFRPPYGSYNTRVREVAYVLNKTMITWDFDSEDSLNATVPQSQQYYTDLIQSRPDSVIALNHETEETTAKQLASWAVDAFQAAGYNLVTVAECLDMDPYTHVGDLGVRDSETWTC